MLPVPISRLVAFFVSLLCTLTILLLIFHGLTSIQEVIDPLHSLKIQQGIKIPQEVVDQYLAPLKTHNGTALWPTLEESVGHLSSDTEPHPYLEPLLQCHQKPNPHTNHIRLSTIVRNVSQLVSPDAAESERKFNPTIIALPPWAANQYLLVSRVVTNGLHQESLICEASICSNPHSTPNRRPDEPACTDDETTILGTAGGLHCKTPPVTIDIPPTPAQYCEGSWAPFPDIPGFHDPRIFWSGRGEPLIMVNSASRYACVGLWLVDLRTLHPQLKTLLEDPPNHPSGYAGPLMSYSHLTELTRNPASTRASVEKNWFLFYPTSNQAFLHYDLSVPRHDPNTNKTIGGRTFAKLIGNGFTTPNLTDPHEKSCLHDDDDDNTTPNPKISTGGTWHQTSNALKLILCLRRDVEHGTCDPSDPARAVHFAVMHRKFSNEWKLPLRYERFLVVWDSRPRYRVLARSRWPVLMANETASGWDGEENWADKEEKDMSADRDGDWGIFKGNASILTTNQTNIAARSEPNYSPLVSHNATSSTHSSSRNSTQSSPRGPKKLNWAYFTYTTSIAWAWRPTSAYDHTHAHTYDHDSHLHPHHNDNYQRQNQNQKRDEGATPNSNPYAPFPDSDTNPNPNSSEDTQPPDPIPIATEPNKNGILESLSIGYLDDEVILGIGVDDQGQVFARLAAADVLGCLRMCPV